MKWRCGVGLIDLFQCKFLLIFVEKQICFCLLFWIMTDAAVLQRFIILLNQKFGLMVQMPVIVLIKT